MNQDFTVQKKVIFVWKKVRAEGFTGKKIPAQAVSEKKNSCKLKIPHPTPLPQHFSNGPSLRSSKASRLTTDRQNTGPVEGAKGIKPPPPPPFGRNKKILNKFFTE